MANVITVRGYESATGEWQVELRYRDNKQACSFRDPISACPELSDDCIGWLLEDYAVAFPYNTSRADSIKQGIERYREELYRQLNLRQFVSAFIRNRTYEGVIILDIETCESAHGLQKFHWEVLEVARKNTETDPPFIVGRRITTISTIEQTIPIGRISPHLPSSQLSVRDLASDHGDYDILLIVSRPWGKGFPRRGGDVDPLLAAQAILDARERLKLGGKIPDRKVNLEIVRPGTMEAFRNHLECRKKKWLAGECHRPYFDVVHFDVHGTVDKGEAVIILSSKTDSRPLALKADVIGSIVREYRVPLVVLNACSSARASENPSSNFAQQLIQQGVPMVVAMSFTFTTSAARIFMRAFYHQLLSDITESVLNAVLAGRRALFQKPERRGSLGKPVDLPDYLIPVLYSTSDLTASHSPGATTTESEKFGQESTTTGKSGTITLQRHVLELEWLLFRKEKFNEVLLTGMAGSGKTKIAKTLGSWWPQAGPVTHDQNSHYLDFRTDSVDFAVRRLQALISPGTERSTTEKQLVILDHIDAIPSNTGGIVKAELRSLLDRFTGDGYLKILICRTPQPWLNVHKRRQYEIGHLSITEARTLSSQIVRKIRLSAMLQKEECATYLDYTNSLLSFNPLSIKLFLRAMPVLSIDYVTNPPKALFDTLLRNFVLIKSNRDYKLRKTAEGLVKECSKLVEDLWKIDGAMMTSLSLPRNSFCAEWLATPIHRVSFCESQAFLGEASALIDFIDRHIVSAGWAQIYGECCVRIHPLLTNFIRSYIFLSGFKLLSIRGDYYSTMPTNFNRIRTSRRDSGFINYLHLNPGFGFPASGFPTKRPATAFDHQETLGLLAIFDAYNNMPRHEVSLNGDMKFTSDVLCVLWEVALKPGQAMVTTREVVQRARKLMGLLKTRLSIGQQDEYDGESNFDRLAVLCNRLSQFYHPKDPEESVKCSEICLKSLQSMPSGMLVNSPHRRYSLAKTLFYLGRGYFLAGRYHNAKKACELCLCCCTADGRNWENSNLGEIGRLAKDRLAQVNKELSRPRSISPHGFRTQKYEAHSKPTQLPPLDLHKSASDTKLSVLPVSDESRQRRRWADIPPSPEDHWSPPALSTSNIFYNQGKIDDAKQHLHVEAADAIMTGDKATEYACHSRLAELATSERNWAEMAQHLDRLQELDRKVIGGRWHVHSRRSREQREALLGCAWLIQGSSPSTPDTVRFVKSLEAFWSALTPPPQDSKILSGVGLRSDKFFEFAIFGARAGLIRLATHSINNITISDQEFCKADDIMKDMLKRYMADNWPRYTPSKDKLQALERHYLVSENDPLGGRDRQKLYLHELMALFRMVRMTYNAKQPIEDQLEQAFSKLNSSVVKRSARASTLDMSRLEQLMPVRISQLHPELGSSGNHLRVPVIAV